MSITFIQLLFFCYEKRKPTLTTLSGKTTPSVIKFTVRLEVDEGNFTHGPLHLTWPSSCCKLTRRPRARGRWPITSSRAARTDVTASIQVASVDRQSQAQSITTLHHCSTMITVTSDNGRDEYCLSITDCGIYKVYNTAAL